MKDPDELKRTTVGTFSLADILNAKPTPTAPDATRPQLNFLMDPGDQMLIGQIVQRIAEVAKAHGFTRDMGYTFDAHLAATDVANVHCNGTPLRLLSWLMASQVDFMEDYAGIVRHVNRVSGGLNGEWRPRFAATKQ